MIWHYGLPKYICILPSGQNQKYTPTDSFFGDFAHWMNIISFGWLGNVWGAITLFIRELLWLSSVLCITSSSSTGKHSETNETNKKKTNLTNQIWNGLKFCLKFWTNQISYFLHPNHLGNFLHQKV